MNALEFDRLLWPQTPAKSTANNVFVLETAHGYLRYLDTQKDNRPSLVFLCDPPVQVESYQPLIELLGASYRLIAVELPGYGQSKIKSGKAMAFRDTTEQLAMLLNTLRLKQYVLIAPCVTCFVAVSLVKNHGLKPASLILMQAPSLQEMRAWTDRMDPKKLLRTPYLGQLLMRIKAKGLARFWMHYASGSKQAGSKLAAEVSRGMDAGASYPLASMLQSWYRSGPADGSLEIPTLSIWGRRDRSHAETPCGCTAAHSSDMVHLEMHNTGHFSELEDPEQFVRLVAPFLHRHLSG
ncbi:MAG TPA: alpha/beta hydrolase [Limnobacter sp.]|nr:alpha/beta hydrolase [Limnobacter sp.]